jgi:hypothetical protein
MTEATNIVGLCEDCIGRKAARARWEELTVLRGPCNACNEGGLHPAFKVGYLGEPDCTDCVTSSHCETHHKEAGLYPY